LGFLYRKKLAKLQAVFSLLWQKTLARSCGGAEIQSSSSAPFTVIGIYARYSYFIFQDYLSLLDLRRLSDGAKTPNLKTLEV
jgi:hypothetical protein